jgi:predicted RNA-binding protein with EMAP domain
MSNWFRDDTAPLLLQSAVQIAWDYLERSGEIDDPIETSQFLVGKIEFMMAHGQRNKLALSNRAISAFQRYRRTRTIEVSLASN